MKKPTARSRERGAVLLTVLIIVLVLTSIGAGLYVVTESQRVGFVTVRQHELAVARANAGAQVALAQLRALQFNTAGWATSANYAASQVLRASAGAWGQAVMGYNDAGTEIYYEADVFDVAQVPFSSNSAAMVMIHSTGYSGAHNDGGVLDTANSPNLSSAVFELKIQMPTSGGSGYAGSN